MSKSERFLVAIFFEGMSDQRDIKRRFTDLEGAYKFARRYVELDEVATIKIADTEEQIVMDLVWGLRLREPVI